MTLSPNPDTDLAFTRTLNAPRDLVWACWTDPALLPKWFMPAPHTVEEAEIDLRPGGIFRTKMNVDGNIMDSPGVILEADPTRRLVFTDAYSPGWIMNPSPFMTAILTFSDAEGGGTTYDVLVRHASTEARDNHEKMGFFEGWGTVADQLGVAASAMAGPAPDRELLLTRRIDAPVALAWKAWTDPELLPKWWGPEGYHCETESIDLRPGGHWRFTMIGEGQRHPNLHDFGEMEKERRLTYRLSGFDDMRHHADVVVEFTEEAGGTRVTMRMTLADMAAAEAMQFGALEKGYETLAKLEQAARRL
ncbi:SRPBCC domain-containing protein [Pseudooceanicola sp.]|uniref:SRPBCC domain-containing protein n=1 Tax=Pseudooceanicola sp. TaxID=1914328 RepID=UPI0035C6C37F